MYLLRDRRFRVCKIGLELESRSTPLRVDSVIYLSDISRKVAPLSLIVWYFLVVISK
jgi:hypothetical protein